MRQPVQGDVIAHTYLALRKTNARGVDTNLPWCDIVRGESPVEVLRLWLPLPYVAVDLRELQEWFEPEELQGCPQCVEHAAITIEHSGAVLCFHCGFIRWRGGETSIEELLRSQLPVEAHGETASASPRRDD